MQGNLRSEATKRMYFFCFGALLKACYVLGLVDVGF
jgi:hypothetical protein